MSDTVHLSLDDLRDLIKRCLTRNGCDDANADAIVNNMAWADANAATSHGIFRLPGYVASLKSGKVDGKAAPDVSVIAPAVARVDGKGGFAPLALERGIGKLVELAKAQGIAALSLNNIHHFAALWPEVEKVVEHDLCALAVTAASPMVAPAGGTKPFFGTNPIAFGWPRKDQPPVVFDMATARMARGEIMIAARDGHTVPDDAGIDENGNPTTDPNEILKGAQLPFGGYKGSAISMMVELLAGGLIGDLFSYESGAIDNKDGGPPRGGELILAMDPARFGNPDTWLDHSEDFFAELAKQSGARLPGSRRHKARLSTPETGVDIPKTLYDKVLELSD
ncbi:MAG: Ldh family oxidoreductase [Alphaproteobacteria bacterium]